MSRYIRPQVPGATIHFTVRLERRGSSTLTDHIEDLRVAMRRTRTERPFRIDAIVVLPDHLHTIWTLPSGDADYATRWHLIKARFSLSVPGGAPRHSHLRRRERGLWQRRYWEHHVRSPSDHAALVRRCWHDPVRHGLVCDPRAWPFSSIHRDTCHTQGRHPAPAS